jgi:hypothetical protein
MELSVATSTSLFSEVSWYRRVTKKDVRVWEVVRENLDSVEACPEDYLLHPWIAVGKKPYPSEAPFEIETNCSPSSSRDLYSKYCIFHSDAR